MAEIIIIPALVVGAVIGLYESILLHRDVTVPTHRFGHTLHAFVYAIIAVFITMNTGFVYSTFSFLHQVPFLEHAIVFQIAIGLITVVKIHGTSYAIRSRFGMASTGMAETWTHALLVGALVVAAPYAWPFIEPMLPAWLK
ncbi:hypothetical protein KY314_00615 [Candidatus Woesearchaeota archaeon]|nr:hypothetical protein [Candidatus Woesearchaeota archaeon]